MGLVGTGVLVPSTGIWYLADIGNVAGMEHMAKFGGLATASGGALVVVTNRNVKKITEDIGREIARSTHPSVQALRRDYKYIMVGWKGNLVGTNKKPRFRKIAWRKEAGK